MTREELRQKVIEKVHTKLPNTSLEIATEMVERSEEFFLTYTNRKKVPSSAFWLWVDMAVSIFQSSAGEVQGVKTIKEGDTTVEFIDVDIKTVLNYYQKSLNMYRKVMMR